jgi:hypothetical protein
MHIPNHVLIRYFSRVILPPHERPPFDRRPAQAKSIALS